MLEIYAAGSPATTINERTCAGHGDAGGEIRHAVLRHLRAPPPSECSVVGQEEDHGRWMRSAERMTVCARPRSASWDRSRRSVTSSTFPPIAYFNVASLATSLRSAVAAGEEALRWRAQPWRIRATDWFTAAERRRSLFAELIGATAGGIVLVPTTSYGLRVAATNLRAGPGDRVLVLADEYPSGVYTWRRFVRRTRRRDRDRAT